MGIMLYPHNEAAYQNAVSMLETTGKAAIIHPTGTGKTFIAFRLVEEMAGKRFLWLSPSDYIFRVQMANLLRETPDFPAERITFLTYARVMMLTEEEIKELHPDYIILDEFHRCGARAWGKSLNLLLSLYPEAKILGLSATSIRYLDNNRNMAEELFDQNVASEMTLGESITRGILPAPVYVSAVYQYDAQLESYQARIRSMRGRGTQDLNQKYLDALRRKLEASEGLDGIFSRYMTRRDGKYIVFCANVEHLQEMQQQSVRWFQKVDAHPHLYTVYADSPKAEKEFEQFQTDESHHLKLLYCIDMLNEGVHVRGISGVILFRPTVSPIIYKQQIGRALTAGENSAPLIIDVVNNAESLCSIDTIKEEMASAASMLRQNGRAEEIVTETFTIHEQVEDCRKLFEQLETSLSGTWDQYFLAAKAYSDVHGHTLLGMPRRYVSPGGLSVGNWVQTQKLVRAGRQLGSLSDAQIRQLDGIGMVWQDRRELQFEKKYNYAKAYFEEHGNLLVPASYQAEDGFRLGFWIMNLRQRYAKGERTGMLSDEHREKLDAIGMCWDASDHAWEQNFAQALAWYQEHGSIAEVPSKYVTETGFALGAWLSNMRRAYQGKGRNRALTEEQIHRLESIGMRWETQFEENWMKQYQAARDYYDLHGSLDHISTACQTPEEAALARWINRQQTSLQAPQRYTCRLAEERIRLLSEIGIRSEAPSDPWDRNFAVLKEYQKEYHTLDLSQDVVYQDVWVGKWLSLQKKAHEDGTLSAEHTAALESIGYDWMNRSERQWQERYREASDYYQEHGKLPADSERASLRRWLQKQDARHSKGKLKPRQIILLEEMGMRWNH